MKRSMYIGSRLTIYVLIAILSTLIHSLGKIDAEAIEGMIWTDWTVLCLSPMLAALGAVRAYLDQSLSNKKGEV